MNDMTIRSDKETKKNIIAVCGKGGVGKTAFISMLTKVLTMGESTGKLLVIDADPALGLPHTLGITVAKTIGEVRETIIDTARQGTREDKEEIANELDYMVFESLVEAENYAFLAMGRTDSKGCFCPVNSILQGAISTLSETFDTILIDGEAGLEQINRQVVSKVELLIILTDTSFRGRETVEHIKKLVVDEKVIHCEKIGVIFNRVQDESSKELLYKSAAEIGVEVIGVIPQDENIVKYDLIGQPLTQLPENSPALAAIAAICSEYIT